MRDALSRQLQSQRVYLLAPFSSDVVWTINQPRKSARCDQVIKLTTHYSGKAYPDKLRRVKYADNEQRKTYVFLTNNFEVSALEVALLYKHRWNIELFFKWIKQHLKIKTFWGESENAVKTQIWIAICTYLMVAIGKKELNTELNRDWMPAG